METQTGGILTVGQLKKILSTIDDSRHVVIANDSWYLNVSSIATPDDDSYAAVTMFTADTYDSRQH